MRKTAWLFTIALLACTAVKAQESIGLFYDNYLPSSGMMRNPAAPVMSPFPWQVNIVSAGFFANNNYVYVPKYNTIKAIRDGINNNDVIISLANTDNVHGHAYSFVQGPSGFVQLNNGLTIGIITATKYATSVISDRAPQSLDVFKNFSPGDNSVIPAFKAAYLHWTEIGLNLGTSITPREDGVLAIGVNMKYLGATDGFYLNNGTAFNASRDSFFTQQDRINTAFGYSGTAGNNRPGSLLDFNFNGRGAGADIGILYTGDANDNDELYDYKVGAALTDIGVIHFTRQSSTYLLNRDVIFNEETELLRNTTNLQELAANGAPIVYDDLTEKAFTGNTYNMTLPMAVSISAEKSLNNGFYLGVLAVQRIVTSSTEVKRPNTFAVVPRYEKKKIAVTLPLVMYDNKRFYMGTSLRVGPVIIGSDNIISWFVPSNYYGTDIYVGVHLNPFGSSSKKSSHWGKHGTKQYGCWHN